MLVLTREVGQKIVINDDVTLSVISISHGKVRLGFVAPKEVPIFRQELLESQPKEEAARDARGA